MNTTDAIKAHKLSQGMVDALSRAAFREHATGRGEAGYVIYDMHPRTRKALHDRGLMYGHYYLTRKGIEVLATLAGNDVDLTGYVWEGNKLIPSVEIQGKEPNTWAPDFTAQGASECYFGCGVTPVAVFVDYVGRTEGVCVAHRDRVESETYELPTVTPEEPQTDAESLSVDDLTPNGRATYAYYANNGMDAATALRKAADMCGVVKKEESTMDTIPTVNVVQAYMGMNGMNHYHAPGCRDIAREAKRHNAREGMGVYEFPFSSVAAIIEHEYSDCNNGDAHDMVSHANDDFDGLKIMSCLRDSLPLGDIQGYPLLFQGGRWMLGDMPLDSERCTVCEVFGNVAENSTDVDGKHVCGYCVDNGRSVATLDTHSLVFYVETEGKGKCYECSDCGAINNRAGFAETPCVGGGFVEPCGALTEHGYICGVDSQEKCDACKPQRDDMSTVASLTTGAGCHTVEDESTSTGTTQHPMDAHGGQWTRFEHVLSVGDIVRSTETGRTLFEVYALIPGLPVVYVDPCDGREPFPMGATSLYAL